jgi:hypothetical protein
VGDFGRRHFAKLFTREKVHPTRGAMPDLSLFGPRQANPATMLCQLRILMVLTKYSLNISLCDQLTSRGAEMSGKIVRLR